MAVAESFSAVTRACSALKDNRCLACPNSAAKLSPAVKQLSLERRVEDLESMLSPQALYLMPEFTRRLKLLRDLRYVDTDMEVVQLKGRAACEINSGSQGEELLIVEMIFNGLFDSLDAAESAALLACSVCKEGKKGIRGANNKEKTYVPSTESLQRAVIAMREVLEELQVAQTTHMITCADDPVDEDYAPLVYQWAVGLPFAALCDLAPDVQEGMLVRAIMRLVEGCREAKNAARVIGDSSLFAKMEEASTIIKRDIVFAASLYVT